MARHTVAALLCSAALVGCEGATEPPTDPMRVQFQTSAAPHGNPLLGSWALTSAAVTDEVELQDLSLILTFWGDGTFTMTATNTSGNFVCAEPHTSCTVGGTYEYTATTITTNTQEGPAPEFGRDTGLYALCGGRLIYLDFQGDEEGIRLTFVRTRRDCYVNDCT